VLKKYGEDNMKKSIVFKCTDFEVIRNLFEGLQVSAFWVTPKRSIKIEYNESDTDKIVNILTSVLQENDSFIYTVDNKIFRVTKENGQKIIDEMQEYLLPKNRQRFKKELEDLLHLLEEGLI
jgi:lipopolysaccharide biosynthesis regulator YciM